MNEEKISILIVDDEPDLLEMYREFFEMDGFEVYTARSAKEGIETYNNHKNISVIISDSNLGSMSGIDFLKTLKASYQSVPNFYLSTGAMEVSEDDVKLNGGQGLVLKPFDLDEILIKIKEDLKL